MFDNDNNKMEPIIEFINPVIQNIAQQVQKQYLMNIDPETDKKIKIGLDYLNDLRHPKFAKVLELYPFDPNNFSEEQFKNIEKGYQYIGNHSYEFFGKYADQQDLIYNYVNNGFLLWYFFGALLVLNSLRIIFILLFDKKNRQKEYRGGFGGAIERGLRGVAIGSLWYPVVYPDLLNRFYKTIYHAFPNMFVGHYVLFPHFPGRIDLEYFEVDKYLGLVPTTSYLLLPDPTPHIIKVVYKTPKILVERWSGTEIMQEYSMLGRIWKMIYSCYAWFFVTAKSNETESLIVSNNSKTEDFVDWFAKDINFYPGTSEQFYSFTEKIKNLYDQTHFNYNDLPDSINRFNFPDEFRSRVLNFDLAKWKSINEEDKLIQTLNPLFKGLNLPGISNGEPCLPLQGNLKYASDIEWIQNNMNHVIQNEANFELNQLITVEQQYQRYLKNIDLNSNTSNISLYKIYHLIFDPLLIAVQDIITPCSKALWQLNYILDMWIIGLPRFILMNLGTAFAVLTFSYVLRRGRYYLGRLFRYYLGHTIILEMLSRFMIPFYFAYYKWVEQDSFPRLSDEANQFTKFISFYKDTHRDDFIFTADAVGWSVLFLPILLFIASQLEQYFYVKYLTDSALIHIGTRRPGESD